MAIKGLPRALPECSDCKDPVRRPTWTANGGKCSGCMTPADRMRAEQRRLHLAKLAADQYRRPSVEARIDELAARRAARASGDPLARRG